MHAHNITKKYEKAGIYKAFCKRSHFSCSMMKIRLLKGKLTRQIMIKFCKDLQNGV